VKFSWCVSHPPRVGLLALAVAREIALLLQEQAHALAEPAVVVARGGQVLDLDRAVLAGLRIVDDERGEVGRQEARALRGLADGDEVRQVERLVADLHRGDGAHRGMDDGAGGRVPRVHQVAAALVAALAARERADERRVLHLAGDRGEVFGDLDAVDGGLERLGGAGRLAFLRIERVDVRGAAREPHDDARLRGGPGGAVLREEEVERGLAEEVGLLRRGEPEEPAPGRAEEGPAGHVAVRALAVHGSPFTQHDRLNTRVRTRLRVNSMPSIQ
jgi:hypothetical protein